MAETEAQERPTQWTLPLRKAIETTNGPISYLELREPTIGEVDKMVRASEKNGGIDGALLLIQLITGVDKPFLEKLSARDFQAASDYLGFFIGGSRKAGSTPSPI